MAVDKLVDSTQLDADLASVANAIRAKSGGSSDLAFPAGFVSEVQAIPSGGDFTYVTRCNITNQTLPTSYSLDAPNTDVMLATVYGVQNLTLNVKSIYCQRYASISYFSSLRYIKWNGKFSSSDCRDFFANCSSLETIDAVMDMSPFTQYGNFFINATSLKVFRFVANSIKQTVSFAGTNNDAAILQGAEFRESLISLANALDESVTGKTFGIGQARSVFNAITGEVNSDNLFEYDENGTVTLPDFVVNTKGWSYTP